MLEPLRSQYLAALGIENYAPRFILPGAKLSESCAWLEAPDEAANVSLLIGEGALPDTIGAEKNLPEKNITEKTASANVQRAPTVEPTVKRPARIDESVNAKAATTQALNPQTNTGPRFALSIVLAAGGILLIDDAPASSADRSGYQKLLSNMLPALRPAAAQYVLDIFLWPMTQQSKISRDANAAKETLAAHLHKQIQQRAIDTVLLLGDAAQQWCTLDTDVRIVKSTSLLACLRDPALKRPLWNDIRHLGAAPE